MKIGDQSVNGEVTPTKNAKDLQMAKLGHIKLAAGEADMVLEPTKVPTGDLMNVFEVDLTPVK